MCRAVLLLFCFFFQAEDGIRDAQESRGLGDVYKRQTDNYALSPNGSYIFSTNNTGVWINDSAAFFTTTPFWVNVTKTLNSTVGTWVGYRWYFNDIVGN